MTQNTEIAKMLEEMGLTYKSEFVPFSMSRNKDEEFKSLNWVVTLVKDGKDVLTTDFMMGQAHCPSYKKLEMTYERNLSVDKETETGFSSKKFAFDGDNGRTWRKKKLELDFVSFVWSMVLESDVLNYPSFDDWAFDQGYDTDSREAEKIYRTCLELAIKLQCALGHETIDRLRVVYENY